MDSQDFHKIFDTISEVTSSLATCGCFAKKDHILSCKASLTIKRKFLLFYQIRMSVNGEVFGKLNSFLITVLNKPGRESTPAHNKGL